MRHLRMAPVCGAEFGSRRLGPHGRERLAPHRERRAELVPLGAVPGLFLREQDAAGHDPPDPREHQVSPHRDEPVALSAGHGLLRRPVSSP
ncbi:hypothetical protein BVI434_1000011 [Burkholderia vietnamiensis]|nr:hypothetical protein BVI434_1000011 [Burkholderia vietnamiensis]